MSEVVQTNLSPAVPESWRNQYSDIALLRTANGQDWLYGVDKETGAKTRLSWQDLETSVEENYGFKPESWDSESYNADPEYWQQRIENGLLKTESYGKPDNASDELEDLKNTIESLRGQLDGALARVSRLEEVKSKNERLTALNSAQAQRISELETRLADLGGAVSESRTDQSAVAAREPALETAEIDEKTNAETSGLTNRWNRLTGWLGAKTLGAQASLHNGMYNITDRQGRREVVLEQVTTTEVVDGYADYERRRGRNILLGAIGAVALAGAAYWLGTKHGHDVNNYATTSSDGEITTLKSQVNNLNEHLTEMQSTITAQHAHAHAHELQAISGLQHQVGQLRTQEALEHAGSQGSYAGHNGSYSLDNWTWSVAHHYRPGNETELMARALKQYGHGAHLATINGTTQIALGSGRVVNLSEMRQINAIVTKLSTS